MQAQGLRPSSVTLTAGRASEVSDSGSAPLSAGAAEQYTSWIDGQLVFRDAPATEVLATLTRWYGYQFRSDDSLVTKQTLTALISTRSASAALTTLKLVLGVDLKFQGNVVTLTPRRKHTSNDRVVPQELISHSSEVGR